MSSNEEHSFEVTSFLIIDRIERNLQDLKDQVRGADEFLLVAHAKVNELIQKQGPGVPSVLVDNQMPQSIGVQAGWVEGQFVVRITHRGEDGIPLLSPGTQMELEV
jgi:hypothetical protein